MGIIAYDRGQVLGKHGIKYLEEAEPVFYRSREGSADFRERRMKRRAVFECPLCSKHFETAINAVQCGKTKSCGCFSKTQNGLGYVNNEETPLHYIWRSMKSRCNRKGDASYRHYGGRGIKVCEEWQQSFLAFHDWAINNGYEQGLQLDRRDNDGNYEPRNCRFVTCKVNQSNRRNNVCCFLDGEKMTASEVARRLEISSSAILNWAYGRFPNRYPARLTFEKPVPQLLRKDKKSAKYCWLDGQRMSLSEAARKLGFSQSTVWNWAQGKRSKKTPSNLVFEEPSDVPIT
jgi:DNA-binding transcriptional regulator YiaG